MSNSCDLMGYNPSGSSVHGIFQARILQWVAISSSRGTSQPRDWTLISGIGRFFTTELPRKFFYVIIRYWIQFPVLYSRILLFIYFIYECVKSLSRVWLFSTPWTVAYQVPPSMGFSRQEYWSGLPFPSPGDLPNSGIEPRSPTL